MKNNKLILILVYLIVILSFIASLTGILSDSGNSSYNYKSIRGENVTVHGIGLYKHMSAEVAVQGIAQDYITLCLGIPLLIISLVLMNKKKLKGQFLLAGTLGYFFVTYLFYTTMSMYNYMFLLYVTLLALTFFALYNTIRSFDFEKIISKFKKNTPVKFCGSYLIFNSIIISLLWLSIIIPPLINGSIYPPELEHYTTLIVQGLDLGLLLPIGLVSGILLLNRKPEGYIYSTIYYIFLSILMIALVAKIIGMYFIGENVVPVIFIIPSFAIISTYCAYRLFSSIEE